MLECIKIIICVTLDAIAELTVTLALLICSLCEKIIKKLRK